MTLRPIALDHISISRRVEGGYGLCILRTQMPKATAADDRYPLSRLEFAILDAVVSRYSCAEKWRCSLYIHCVLISFIPPTVSSYSQLETYILWVKPWLLVRQLLHTLENNHRA